MVGLEKGERGWNPINKIIMAIKSRYIIVALMGLMGLALVLMWGAYAYAGAGIRSVPKTNEYVTFTFFTATSTPAATSTNTSDGGGYFRIDGAKKVTMYFTHGGTATTSTTGAKFRVQTAKDTSLVWNDFNKLLGQDVSSTATSTYTIQGATSTAVVALDLSDDTFYAIRVISNETAGALGTDGEHTAEAAAEFD